MIPASNCNNDHGFNRNIHWQSIADLKKHPRSSSIVMLATVRTVVTDCFGVLVGVLLSGIFFAGKISQIFRLSSVSTTDGRARTYIVEGQVFFASAEKFLNSFDFQEALETVTIDLTKAHIWDISTVAELDTVILKFQREGAEVKLVGLNKASEQSSMN